MSTSIIDRLLALFGFEKFSITLIGHEREGGYTYITSPQLSGFTFMLNPGEEKNIRTFIDAIDEPLTTFLDAHFKAEASRDRPVHLTGVQQSINEKFVAQVAFA